MHMTLMMLKKDNDQLREGLSFVLSGGDPTALKSQLDNNEFWASMGKASSQNTNAFKSPKLNEYLFDEGPVEEEFQKFDADKQHNTEKPLRKQN